MQEAADVTAGVDSALATLKSSMAAISEFKEANKYASPVFPWLPHHLCDRNKTFKHPCLPLALRAPCISSVT